MNDDLQSEIFLTEDKGVTKTIITPGKGTTPSDGVEVLVNYTGKLTNGNIFDSNTDKQNPFKFKLGTGNVIKGWDIGVKSMKRGEKSTFTITAPYAYGENGQGEKIPPNSTLIFDIELLDWKREEVTSDGLITKEQISFKNESFDNPNDNANCLIRVSGKIQGSDLVFMKEKEVNYVVGDDASFPFGFIAILTKMKPSEKSLFYIKPGQFHYQKENLPLHVKKYDTLIFEIELISFKNQKESFKMSSEEKIEFALSSKTKGNEFFKKSLFSFALQKYELAVSYIEYFGPDEETDDKLKDKSNEIAIACHNNIAIIKMKENKFSETISKCTQVLEKDSKNTKALYRRSLAYECLREHEKAIKDIKDAITLEKNPIFVKQFHMIKENMKLDENKKKEMYRKMFRKYNA